MKKTPHGMSVAVHLVSATFYGPRDELTEFKGPLPSFGYRRPGTIFCYPGLHERAVNLRDLLDASDGGRTRIEVFNGVEEFPFPTSYDYVVMADVACLLGIGTKIVSDSSRVRPPLLRHREMEKKLLSIDVNMVSIHFPLETPNDGIQITTGNIIIGSTAVSAIGYGCGAFEARSA